MSTLADVIERNLEALVGDWPNLVQSRLAPGAHRRSELVDSLGEYLQGLIVALRQERVPQRCADAREHGAQRYRIGFDLDAVVREYGLLRDCIISLARAANGHVSVQDMTILGGYLITGIAEATTAYVRQRDAGDARWRAFFEQASISIWEEDFTEVAQAVDVLRSRGITDIRAYCAAHPGFVARMISSVKVLDVNQASLRLFGAAHRGELIASLDRLFVPATSAVFVEELVALAEGRTTFEAETAMRTLRGDELSVAFTLLLLRHADGVHAFVTLTDVTERNAALHAATESEDRFRNMADNAPVILWVTDTTGSCTYLNAQWYAFTGQTLEASLGFGWVDVVHPDDAAHALDTFSKAHVERSSFRLDYRLRRHDGVYRWAIDSASPRFDRTGKFLGYVGSVIDITERKELEEQRAELIEQLRAVIDNIPLLAWTATPDGDIDYVNRRWHDYTGTTSGQMQGKGWQALVDPAVLDDVTVRWERAIATGEPLELDLPLRGADGIYRWFLTRANPLRDGSGRIVRWFGSSTNVDDQRRQAQALREAIDARDTFLSVASHELKTPLTSLGLRLQVLAQDFAAPDAELSDRHRKDIAVMQRQVDRLGRLIDELLDVTRASAGPLPLERSAVELGTLTREVVARFEPEAQQSGTPITLSVHAEARGHWDRGRIDQLVTNLISNAIKYGAHKPIDVVVDARDGRAQLVVKDRGIGISADALPKIFEKFERAVPMRNYGGLGLGLYICAQVVRAHGGTIAVTSEPGAGSTFTAELPLA